MYPKTYPNRRSLVDIDDLDTYREDVICREVEDDVLSAADAGIIRGNNLGSIYEEEEEED